MRSKILPNHYIPGELILVQQDLQLGGDVFLGVVLSEYVGNILLDFVLPNVSHKKEDDFDHQTNISRSGVQKRRKNTRILFFFFFFLLFWWEYVDIFFVNEGLQCSLPACRQP